MPGTIIRTVALIGANGKVGPNILQVLLDMKSFQVTVISRKSSKSTYQQAVKVEQVDDSLPKDQLVGALRGHDALVIAFSGSQPKTRSSSLMQRSRPASNISSLQTMEAVIVVTPGRSSLYHCTRVRKR